jgi:hypothetical protein
MTKSKQLLVQAQVRTNPAKRLVSTKVRGAIAGNTVLDGNEVFASIATTAAGVQSIVHVCSGGSALGRINSPIAAVARLYSNFKYLPGTAIHYVPNVGTNTNGTVTICYIDNPEVMLLAITASLTPGTFSDFVRAQANARSYSAWESFSYPIMPAVRKMYHVNASLDFGAVSPNPELVTIDTVERSVQGMFLIGIDGAPANTTIGRCWLHNKLQLENLRGLANT